jgi:hypothetical protein
MVSHEDLLVTMTVLISVAVIIETVLIIWGVRSVNRMFTQVAGNDR